MKTIEIIKDLTEKAVKLNRKENRIIKTWPIGKVVRQGDVYIHRVADDHPVGDMLDIRKIADGTSIGSRHILIGDVKVYQGVKLPSYVNNRWPLGYAFNVGQEGMTITHPEHAHIDTCVKGRYVVTHQMDMQTMQRVSD
jgi:hypothetical protein